jgi:HAD superfamily hydrolase (TIGR01662 family)
MKTALLLDLDGTIIETASGKVFSETNDDWRFIRPTLEAIKKSKYKDIFIITNQQGIEKGYITEDDFKAKARDILKALKEEGIEITALRYASSSKNAKPKPNMAYALAKNYHIDLAQSLYVGDRNTDKKFADNVGMKFMFVKDFIKG